jgi:hypothetical protein
MKAQLLEVLGSVTRLPEIIKEYDVSTVYIVTPLQDYMPDPYVSA